MAWLPLQKYSENLYTAHPNTEKIWKPDLFMVAEWSNSNTLKSQIQVVDTVI